MRTAILAIAFFMWLPCAGAQAQSCTFTIDDIDFGSVDVLSGSAKSVPASLAISCTGLALNTVRVCASIGAGSGGAVAGARRLQGPSGTLDYQLYQGSGPAVWGSNSWGLPGSPPTIDVPLNLGGNGSLTVPFTAEVLAGQQTAPIGSYLSSFTAADNDFDYGYTFLGIVGCNLIPLLPQVGTTTFAVRAEIEDNCHVSATDIDFGQQGGLIGTVDEEGEVSVTCTSGSDYILKLDDGQAAAGPIAREMRQASLAVTYGIYRDAARTLPWGEGVGQTISGTGSGLEQDYTTFGRVPPQVAAAGSYSDTVVVTVEY
jgi:spore coat protein U-like protein